MTHDDGGHAFPQCAVQFDDGGMSVTDVMPQGGISIRDYFAAAAMAGGLQQGATSEPEFGTRPQYWYTRGAIAGRAYDIADAMLAERAKE